VLQNVNSVSGSATSLYYAFHGTPGAPFFFKLKAPRNAIGGFGYAASFSRLPDWLAWECFGEGNGAATFEDFKRRLDTLRERNRLRGAGGLPQIGCIVLVQAIFFTPEQWVPQPSDGAARNLRYTRYDLTTGEARASDENARNAPPLACCPRVMFWSSVRSALGTASQC
jgi:putative restriction endonuclease